VDGAKTEEAESFVNGSAYSSAELLDANATQEIPAYAESVSSYAAGPLTEEAPEEPAHVEAAEGLVQAGETVVPEQAAAVQQPNMDELIARVLAKMNPDVMQRVTQEILKPVIEALIKEELQK